MNKINDRFKKVRQVISEKEGKNFSQKDFAIKIGIAQTTYSSYENGAREIPDFIIISICREFNINETWLRNGEGEMFIKTQKDIIDELSEKYNLSNVSRKIIETYLNMDDKAREVADNYLKTFAKAISEVKEEG